MDSQAVRVGIVGVSGYSGMELARILSQHPRLDVAFVVSDKWAGRSLGDCLPVGEPAASLSVLSQAEGIKRLGTADLVFLCTPAEVSLSLAPQALDAGA